MAVSVTIICFNEERNIRRCLESAKWADEIIVVDSLSQDKTIEIAREYTKSVFQRAWTGYVDQKNYALSKAQGDWIFNLDADEEIPVALKEEILSEISKSDALDGYRMPRRSFYQDRWIHHSGFYPDKQLRFFRREKGLWVGGRIHERVEIRGRIGILKNDLLHYPYKNTITGQLQTVNSFSTLLAEDMHERGKHYHSALLLTRPILKFIEVYFLKLGLLDGLAGFIIAVTSAYAIFVRYVKLKEIEKGPANESSRHF